MQNSIKTLADIDWPNWAPVDHATLLFVIQDGRILLIEKKRGLGGGKVNGPGGRLEPGETPRAAAIREVQEELCITPLHPSWRGRLEFQFCDGYSLRCEVFTAPEYAGGEPQETDEAKPLWTNLDAIPYERMWADDEFWLPQMIAGQKFSGQFIFDGDHMLDHRLDFTST